MHGRYICMKKRIFALIAVALLMFSSVTVMAANSPTPSDYFEITVEGQTVGKNGATNLIVDGGKISVSSGIIEEGKKVTLTVTPDKNNKFSKWVIDGDYEIVEGSLTDLTITIIPKSDLDIDAKFLNSEDEPIKENPTKKPDNDSNVSPKTGVATGAVMITLLASGAIAITSKKKFSE